MPSSALVELEREGTPTGCRALTVVAATFKGIERTVLDLSSGGLPLAHARDVT
jgi:hypothetical protein